jgi:hypothetical protein
MFLRKKKLNPEIKQNIMYIIQMYSTYICRNAFLPML